MDTSNLRTVKLFLETASPIYVSKQLNKPLEDVLQEVRQIEFLVKARLFTFVENSPSRIVPTPEGEQFLKCVSRFLDREIELLNLFSQPNSLRQINIVTSHYMAHYVLIDLISNYRAVRPNANVKLGARTEIQVINSILVSDECILGVCAPLDFPQDLAYYPWFKMGWMLVVPSDHHLTKYETISLRQLQSEELIVFEPGSTGRKHVMEAFRSIGVSPQSVLQATTTQLIVQMVEAKMGIAILPLLASGRVTENKNVTAISIHEPIQAIETGVFVKKEFAEDESVLDFLGFSLAQAI